MSENTKGPIPSHLEGISVNQRRALDRGLSALEAMADIWAAEIRLTPMSEKMADFPETTRAEVIYSMTHQAFIEGAYRHFLDCKDGIEKELNAARALLREVMDAVDSRAKEYKDRGLEVAEVPEIARVRNYLDACDTLEGNKPVEATGCRECGDILPAGHYCKAPACPLNPQMKGK